MSDTIQDKEKQPIKIKTKRPSLKNITETTTKINLNKKEDAVQEQSAEKVDVQVPAKDSAEVESKVLNEKPAGESVKEEIISPITEVVEDKEIKKVEKEYKEAVRDEKVLGKQLPENIEKLVSFMEETGGTVEDYVSLNKDYSKYDDKSLLSEYYKKTKPHLNHDEVEFLMEDNFSYDEEVDEERTVKKRQLALKEEIANAKNFLERSKNKYYDEIKLRPGVTQEQQKAMDFFNRHNKEQQIAEQRRKTFRDNTNKTLNDEFKGFEFNVGDKKFNYNISNPSSVAENQSDLNTFVKKFLNNEGEVVDTVGYHKAIYAADNADSIAKHFYEQGKTDALKDVMAKSKNINAEARPQANGDMFINGMKVRAITGDNSSKLKFKVKNKNNN